MVAVNPLLRTVRRPRAFTLIEVLVVVAIITLLVAILLPSLNRARALAREAVCITQIRQLMAAALMYVADNENWLPGASANDDGLVGQFASGKDKGWLSWSGVWGTGLKPNQLVSTNKAWANAPRGGRLYRYYRDEKILKCPSSKDFNGKFSYSTPENVALANRDKSGQGRRGLPPKMDQVKHPTQAIQFLDEDEENGINAYSVDDGFGEPDLFGDRHSSRATVAFFDGHAAAYSFVRGDPELGPYAGGSARPKPVAVRYPQNKSSHPFEAWMIQIAPFNSRVTPLPWKWSGEYEDWPKFSPNNNNIGCGRVIGCESY